MWYLEFQIKAKTLFEVLNAQNGSISIRIHQNVSRMNCANVLYTKLSKKWWKPCITLCLSLKWLLVNELNYPTILNKSDFSKFNVLHRNTLIWCCDPVYEYFRSSNATHFLTHQLMRATLKSIKIRDRLGQST